MPPFFTLLMLSFQPCVCIQDDERSEDEDEDHVDEVDLGHNVSCKDESGTGDVSQFWSLEANHNQPDIGEDGNWATNACIGALGEPILQDGN